jgi:hypothetical protein
LIHDEDAGASRRRGETPGGGRGKEKAGPPEGGEQLLHDPVARGDRSIREAGPGCSTNSLRAGERDEGEVMAYPREAGKKAEGRGSESLPGKVGKDMRGEGEGLEACS